ncbi:MAG: hypothetical protein AAFV53_19455 [Myxococcota bacterium]
MKPPRRDQLRRRIAQEAARLMYREGVKQYFDAKRIAARRLCGRSGAKRLAFRPHDLPSNGEIREEVLALAALAEGASRPLRLFAMRAVAVQVMEALDGFTPRLIGSVSTGHVRRGSDIDLHVFTDVEDALTGRLHALSWSYTLDRVAIQRGGVIREFTHVYLDRGFPVELSVYPRRDLRFTTRSSTDGKPIVRLSVATLRDRMASSDPLGYARWVRTDEIPDLDALIASHDAAPPEMYAGLLDDLSE